MSERQRGIAEKKEGQIGKRFGQCAKTRARSAVEGGEKKEEIEIG